MGSAVAVELETQSDDGEWTARKYLLTCGHVVRRTLFEGQPGWGPLLEEIYCFPPGSTYIRTLKSSRHSKTHRGAALLAEVHGFSPLNEYRITGVPEELQLPAYDWVLLDVKQESFQTCPAIRIWEAPQDPTPMLLFGYAGGAGPFDAPIFEDAISKVLCGNPLELTLQSISAGILQSRGIVARAGMSGGGYFSRESRGFLGIHRGSMDLALQRFGISANAIKEQISRLSHNRMRPRAAATEHVATIIDALKVVTEVTEEDKAFLRALVDEIELLKTYKSLHDCLHEIQVLLLGLTAAIRVARDDQGALLKSSSTQLDLIVVKIEGWIEDLPDRPPALKITENEWLGDLRNAAGKLQPPRLFKTWDAKMARQCVNDIRRILRLEPPRIDGLLRHAANALELKRLKSIFDSAANGRVKSNNLEEMLRSGKLSSTQLSEDVEALVKQHRHWQTIDIKLWEAEDRMPKSAEMDALDFDDQWEGIKLDLKFLLEAAPGSKWALNLAAYMEELDNLRGKSGSQLDDDPWQDIARCFQGFRLEVIMRFFSVDKSLRKLAGEVAELNQTLRDILQR